jgi:hypothetical protein
MRVRPTTDTRTNHKVKSVRIGRLPEVMREIYDLENEEGEAHSGGHAEWQKMLRLPKLFPDDATHLIAEIILEARYIVEQLVDLRSHMCAVMFVSTLGTCNSEFLNLLHHGFQSTQINPNCFAYARKDAQNTWKTNCSQHKLSGHAQVDACSQKLWKQIGANTECKIEAYNARNYDHYKFHTEQ